MNYRESYFISVNCCCCCPPPGANERTHERGFPFCAATPPFSSPSPLSTFFCISFRLLRRRPRLYREGDSSSSLPSCLFVLPLPLNFLLLHFAASSRKGCSGEMGLEKERESENTAFPLSLLCSDFLGKIWGTDWERRAGEREEPNSLIAKRASGGFRNANLPIVGCCWMPACKLYIFAPPSKQ